jgi:flagellar hook protein FlgE
MLPITMSGLRAAQKELSVTSNNLANAATTGFKRSEANFVDLFPNDPSVNPRTSVGAGAAVDLVSRDTSQGGMKTTGRVTDLAIAGRGYFVLESPPDAFSEEPVSATLFTRAGNFSLDAEGYMVDSNGSRLTGWEMVASEDTPPIMERSTTRSPLKIPPSLPSEIAGETGPLLQNIAIDPKGLVSATYSDTSSKMIGFIAIANFRNDSSLKPVGNTDFSATVESGDANYSIAGAPQAGDIMAGTLEQSNVDITNELMTMLRAQQVYNGNARMLQTSVEVASRILDKI